MKNDIRNAAMNSVNNMLSKVDGLIPVRVGKKDCYAVDTGITDEGVAVYATVEVTVKNTVATKVAPAFDIAQAMADREENDNKPAPERKSKPIDPEKAEKDKKREEQKQILRDWVTENLSDTPMTTTEIHNAIPELSDVLLMQIGTWLKAMAEKEHIIVRTMKENKPHYTSVAETVHIDMPEDTSNEDSTAE